jgi:uncharacterized protein YehS (DUF1456 family)
MNNNDILRSIRYTFQLSDSHMIALFGHAGQQVTRGQISDWLKKEDDPACRMVATMEAVLEAPEEIVLDVGE